MTIATTNPATGETLEVFDALDDEALEARIAEAARAFSAYRLTSLEERARWMRRAAELLEEDTERVARTMTLEMGKPIKASRAEVKKCAAGCRYYAEHAARYLEDEPADAASVGALRAYATYQPLGPVLAVMPWNFPLWQVLRFAAPALMAGNVALLKHAAGVPKTALYLEELFLRAGFPEGVFQTLLVGHDKVERILADPRVAAATLTGSTGAGRSVARIAGQHLKKTVLELGGSDPFVVMPSADFERSVDVAVTARVQNNGQSCIAAKRFLVHEAIAERWTEAFVAKMKALRVGDPTDEATDVGPLASASGLKSLEALVDDATKRGARVLCGGRRLEGRGFFFPPTVVAGVKGEMALWQEEAFGPVAALRTFADLDEAVRLTNDTPFGLGSNFWSEDPAEQARFVRDVEAGLVFLNGMTTSYPALPFGGVKQSGYGRELASHGIREFCNVKTVWVGESRKADPGSKTE